MDVENPLHEDNIPLAKLVYIEVMGQPVEDSERQTNVVNIHVSFNKCIYKVLTCFCTFIVCIICFCGFFIFMTGFPFI
jgi:hypothetical protein